MRTKSLENLRSRRNPEALLAEKYLNLKEDDAIKYLTGSMEPVDDGYTQKTFEEGKRVSNQILRGLQTENLSAEFVTQGSVTKGTHIRAYSDIDILVIDKRSHAIEPPQTVINRYSGDVVADLLQIRKLIVLGLTNGFPKATVDDSKPKSVKVSGGSLQRKVDAVPAQWWDTNDYSRTMDKDLRGVQILNRDSRKREADRPFLHGKKLEEKDSRTRRNFRPLIRLLKSLKYDAEIELDISSYDIESIVYAMPDSEIIPFTRGMEIQLAASVALWLRKLDENAALRDSLDAPDGKRKIFSPGNATLEKIRALRLELDSLLAEIGRGLQKKSLIMERARIDWEMNPYASRSAYF